MSNRSLVSTVASISSIFSICSIVAAFTFFPSCAKDPIKPKVVIKTKEITNLTGRSAESGGEITYSGPDQITAKGVVWSTSPGPTVALATKTIDGTGVNNFTSSISALQPNVTYYLRAYATSASGTEYGNELSFTTNSIDIETGLVAIYPFTGNANDSSGHGNHGVVNGPQLTNDRFNKTSSAYSFNSNQITVPHNSTLNLSGAFTISLWYVTSEYINPQDLVIKGQDKTTGSWWTRIHTSTLNSPGAWFGFRQNGSGITTTNATTLETNTWMHFAVAISGTTAKMYLNGNLSNTLLNIDLSNSASNTSPLTIGKLQYPFNGKMDDIKIFNRSLSDTEITYLANN
jgi:Concanavalin A-like lectin/glucanases superfamily